ncbi:hypothetical protein AWB64_05274 [Caballeronia sordidicola]|uniref:Uncharacterized protein n=1 Tax=Caballeronia sordidicola TaxID=196367 RepID=A0A158I214_CABSO|nr:hypothetical protein AWB64_05274 [Caballeronia sordidicola]
MTIVTSKGIVAPRALSPIGLQVRWSPLAHLIGVS